MPHTLPSQNITPAEALQRLKEGNFRFINNISNRPDYLGQVEETKDAQAPFAAILSCMDSRTSAELIFDQGLGDIFSIRIAGNVVTNSILGSLEYATAAASAKLIVVLGHTGCGAIKGACDDVQLGHLTGLLARIRPAVELERSVKESRDSSNPAFVQKVCEINVRHSVAQILEQSPVILKLVAEGKLMIAGAIYDVATGLARFGDEASHIYSPQLAGAAI